MRKLCTYSGLPYREVGYEELRSEPAKFDEVLKFLGIQPGRYELKTPLKKLNTGSHRELIKNYDAVKLVLENTVYADLLK